MSDIKPLFIPTLNSGVTFWRFYNFVKAGVDNKFMDAYLLWWQKALMDIHPWQVDVYNPEHRARILNEMDYSVKQSDVVVMGMVHTTAGIDTLMGIREMYGKPVVMEIDDNILSTPEYNPASECYGPGSELRKIAIRQMREADAMIVSTPYLKEIYSEFNEHIYVVPNSIDFSIWGKLQHGSSKGKIVIGWAGGATHTDDLEIIEPVVDEISKKHKNIEFRFVHGITPKLKGNKSVVHKVKFAPSLDYPKYLAQQGFDIGLAPLVDNAFNRGKSNLRWLEYGALGVPCVASNVGHFAETIDNGADGFLCDTRKDFVDALELLITDASRRRDIGKAAKAKVIKDFNAVGNSKAYSDILKEIVSRGQIQRTAPVWKDSNHKAEVGTETI